MKYIKFNNINGKKVASVSVNYAYSRYFENLRLDKGFKKSIEDRINLKSDFELTLEELEKLSIAIENKIDELLVDPKFNPFKESLRIKYPEQYSNNPFSYKGKVYYLYTKGSEFVIDLEITMFDTFKKNIDEHILEGQSMIINHSDFN